MPPAGELSGLFFRTGGWTLGDWTMVRALPRTKAQTHKLGWSVEKCFAPGTGRDKKKYMYTCDFSVNVLVKRSSRRTRGLLFIHDHECLFQGMRVSKFVDLPDERYGYAKHLSPFYSTCEYDCATRSIDKEIRSYAVVLYIYGIHAFLSSQRYFLQCANTTRVGCMFITYLQS